MNRILSLKSKISSFKSSFTTLIISSDEMLIANISLFLKKLSNILVESDKPVNRFQNSEIDLIMIDDLSVDVNILIKEFREIDENIPIILMLEDIYKCNITLALNQGVNQFLIKPINKDLLLDAVEICLDRVLVKDIAMESAKKELESFKFKHDKHTDEQNIAFRKELNIIKNDLYYKYLDTKTNRTLDKNWFLNISYQPIDILSGDSYSIRYIRDNKFLFFIFDAMGKGLSASITTILSTSMINHLIDNEVKSSRFSLKRLISNYIDFIQKNILDEEVVSLTLALVDLNSENMDIAMFGMPPILVKDRVENIIKIKTNNLPISKFSDKPNITSYDISQFDRILFYTDGLNEAITKDGIYADYILDDFKNSLYKSHFLNLVASKVKKQDDDVTIIYFNRFKENPKKSINYIINSRESDIENLILNVENFITSCSFSDEFKDEFISSFFELIFNAYEHGNFGISYKFKNTLMSNGNYDEYLIEQEKIFGFKKKIYIKLRFFDKIKKHIVCEIEDEGDGFDTAMLRNKIINATEFHGRGVLVAQKSVDEIFYNKKANRVVLIKIEKD